MDQFQTKSNFHTLNKQNIKIMKSLELLTPLNFDKFRLSLSRVTSMFEGSTREYQAFFIYYNRLGYNNTKIENAWDSLKDLADAIKKDRLLLFRVAQNTQRNTYQLGYTSDSGNCLYFLNYAVYLLTGCPYNCEHFSLGKYTYLSTLMADMLYHLFVLGLITEADYKDRKDTTFYRSYCFM